jgi:hypothetical protein
MQNNDNALAYRLSIKSKASDNGGHQMACKRNVLKYFLTTERVPAVGDMITSRSAHQCIADIKKYII